MNTRDPPCQVRAEMHRFIVQHCLTTTDVKLLWNTVTEGQVLCVHSFELGQQCMPQAGLFSVLPTITLCTSTAAASTVATLFVFCSAQRQPVVLTSCSISTLGLPGTDFL